MSNLKAKKKIKNKNRKNRRVDPQVDLVAILDARFVFKRYQNSIIKGAYVS